MSRSMVACACQGGMGCPEQHACLAARGCRGRCCVGGSERMPGAAGNHTLAGLARRLVPWALTVCHCHSLTIHPSGDKPYVTDNSNYIVDLYFETPIADAHAGGCIPSRLIAGVG